MIALLLALLCGTANALEVKAPSPNSGTITPSTITVSGSTLVTSGGKVGIGTASPATKLHMSSGTLTVDGTGSMINSPNQPSFRATSSATQSIPNNSATEGSVATEEHDNGSFYAVSAATIPAGAQGGYIFTGYNRFGANGTGTRELYIYKNGSLITHCYRTEGGSGTADTTQHITCGPVSLAAGDIIKLVLFQNSGDALNSNERSFSGVKVW